MNPDSRFAASLIGALVLAAPALNAAFRGHRDVESAGIRYLVVFAVLWVCVGFVGRLYNHYLADIEIANEVEEKAETARRRSEDLKALVEAKSKSNVDDDSDDEEEDDEDDPGTNAADAVVDERAALPDASIS